MSKYRYETWRNILTKLEFGKEYSVDKTREDYDLFVDALKSFSRHWWNFVVKESDGSCSFTLLNPVDCINEMIYLHEDRNEDRHEEKEEVRIKRDDFYMKSYNPLIILEQKEKWGSIKRRDEPPQLTTDSAEESNKQSDTLSHPEKNNPSEPLKLSQNEITEY